MNNYLGMYIKEYIILWIKVLVAAGIGILIDKAIGADQGTYVFAFLFALLVYGMTLFDKVVKFDLFGNHVLAIAFWTLKLVISILVGVFAFPIVNIYYITKIIYHLIKK